MDKRSTGTVQFFNDLGGFGFIVPDGGDYPIFVERSGMLNAKSRYLVEGERVEFSFEATMSGPRAASVVSVQTYAAAGD